ncbi:uncharacterized protein LOC144313908 isoform X7 [Canis aureus]
MGKSLKLLPQIFQCKNGIHILQALKKNCYFRTQLAERREKTKVLKQVKAYVTIRFLGDKHLLVSFKILTNGSFLQASLQKKKLAK